MSLVTNLGITFPQLPLPPELKLKQISDGLDLAITTHIVVAFVPAGFAATASIVEFTPIMSAVFLYLETNLNPIISSAITALANPATPIPPLAWQSVRSAVLAIPPPPNLAGPQGPGFWNSILRTVWEAMPATPPVPADSEEDELDIEVRF